MTLDISVPSFDFAKKQPRAEMGFFAKSSGTIATPVFASYNTHVPFQLLSQSAENDPGASLLSPTHSSGSKCGGIVHY